MEAPLGEPVEATLIDPGPAVYDLGLGARIEVPVTRAIVSMFRPAALNGAIWSVFLDSPIDEGDYEIVWRTSDPEPPLYETYVPLFLFVSGVSGGASGGSGGDDWPLIDRTEVTPGVNDVAALERTRTYDMNGTDQATFNDQTKPTDEEVEVLIEQATDDILGVLREDVDVYHYAAIKGAITRQAALYVEGSYFRDNVNADLVQLYRTDIRATLTSINESIMGSGAQASGAGALRLT